MRLALIGDVGGHQDLLTRSLTDLGASVDDGRLPADLAVIQLGDLIDRGPDSAGCVALADRFMRASPGRWIQLLGNHEGNRLGGPAFSDEALDPAALATLDTWWHDRRASLAAHVSCSELGDVVVTHGGVVRPLWELLRRPDAAKLTTTLNSWVGARPELAFAPGRMLGGGAVPGPVWADAGTELYAPWAAGDPAPFHQVHGHSSIFEWPSGRAHRHTPRAVLRHAGADPQTRRATITRRGCTFIGIDPVLGTAGAGAIHPLVLHGEIVAP